MTFEINLPLYEDSITQQGATTYALTRREGSTSPRLVVQGDTQNFTGDSIAENTLLCPLTAANAAHLRERLLWLKPQPLGLALSAGFGDRLGMATPGHIQAVKGTGIAPIFAQQSVRENTRTGRNPQQVLDEAMWGVFQAGWRDPWGADADHLKTIEDVDTFVAAGYTFFTIDPGAYVDDAAATDSVALLEQKVAALDWELLASSPADLRQRLLKTFKVAHLDITFDELALLRAVAKYGNALVHTVKLARHLQRLKGSQAFDLEMSVDETETTTSLHEHFYLGSELQRLNIPVVSLAPRFVGRFEKGVDYIGSLGELEENLAGHAAVQGYFGGSYKISLHSGSDKFSVYPLAARYSHKLIHLKTAGTSYLEALRVIATANPGLFREIVQLACGQYETARQSYHVSASVGEVSGVGADETLPTLLDQFDARQVLHVTFGVVLEHYGDALRQTLHTHEQDYYNTLERHFNRHLQPFCS